MVVAVWLWCRLSAATSTPPYALASRPAVDTYGIWISTCTVCTAYCLLCAHALEFKVLSPWRVSSPQWSETVLRRHERIAETVNAIPQEWISERIVGIAVPPAEEQNVVQGMNVVALQTPEPDHGDGESDPARVHL